VRLEDRVGFDEEGMIIREGSGFVGKNQVLLERIRFCWKESGFVERNQILLVAL
jgi:hypothetical protein